MVDATKPRPAPPHLARLGALAALIHFACDSLTRVFTATTPPYLLIEFMDENYRAVFELLGITAVSAVTSCVNGVIAAVFAAALQLTAGRRAVRLALLYAGIWLLAGGLMALTQLQAPLAVVAGSLLAGLPRSAVLGWVLDRRMAR